MDYNDNWAPKHWCFWTVMLKKTLESPLGCKEIKPVYPKEMKPEYSLEGLVLKLKLQYFGTWYKELTHQKRPWCWERLKVGGEGHETGWDGWKASLTQWTWVWVSSGSWWQTGKPGVLSCTRTPAVLGVSKSQTWLNDWTELSLFIVPILSSYYFLPFLILIEPFI